jgi:hypothetical protein
MANINSKGQHLSYLFDYKDGKIKLGLGLDCLLDHNLRFKPKQLNIILGHDNVGLFVYGQGKITTGRFLEILYRCIPGVNLKI